MDRETLRKVQLEQLEIAKEIKRVCKENGINYFLDSGTLIGAVRHKGFIPWDDDLDIGMMRDQYERFCEIAPKALNKQFYWQNWRTDKEYALPYGKVRKRNTVFIEEKSARLTENGFYVDVFPFDDAPADNNDRVTLINKRLFWARSMLMKHGYKPWIHEGKTNYKQRIFYLLYQIVALFTKHEYIVRSYEDLVFSVSGSDTVYEQIGKERTIYYNKEWLKEVTELEFEGEMFSVPIDTHNRLKSEYGDYMQLPPEDQRGNRHGILEIHFSDDQSTD